MCREWRVRVNIEIKLCNLCFVVYSLLFFIFFSLNSTFLLWSNFSAIRKKGVNSDKMWFSFQHTIHPQNSLGENDGGDGNNFLFIICHILWTWKMVERKWDEEKFDFFVLLAVIDFHWTRDLHLYSIIVTAWRHAKLHPSFSFNHTGTMKVIFCHEKIAILKWIQRKMSRRVEWAEVLRDLKSFRDISTSSREPI
jgi:hypothetical protein